MNAANRHIHAYASVALETGVTSADPHKLILMLYEGALLCLNDAQKYLQQQNMAGKGQAISKAIRIIDEGLSASLDLKVGGEIAQHLRELYEYMCRRLLSASMSNNPEFVAEVHGLLSQLKEAWEAIAPNKQEQLTPSAEKPTNRAGV